MKTVLVNGYGIDDAEITCASKNDVRIDLMHSCEFGEENFLCELSLHQTARRMVSVKIIEDSEIVNAYVEIVGAAHEFSDKLKFVAKCACLPVYDKHGNKADVQLFIEKL
ncbi:hypothetical protein NVP1007O_07 [Vibrio phage 1.007.O._10N.261.55.F9]|nr:hypothetical protein NVP1007O_07 [Vibrio phage 1.007.O._10N.261.55.F9]